MISCKWVLCRGMATGADTCTRSYGAVAEMGLRLKVRGWASWVDSVVLQEDRGAEGDLFAAEEEVFD